jgi:hypothetical protein
LGADNPTFHASVGWIGCRPFVGEISVFIDNVYLSSAGNVYIENPFVKTKLPLPDTNVAD